MIPYILIFLCAAGLFAGYKWFKNDVPYWIFLVILVLFSGLRDMIGGFDVYIYGQLYESDFRIILIYGPFEWGFKLFLLLCKWINDKREFLFFVVALLMLLLHFKVIKKNSNLIYFSLFIYFCKFFLFSFVYLRQGLAMGIVWLTIPFILNRQYLKVTVLFTLAFFFHKSALIFSPLIFIADRRFNNAQLLVGVLVFLGLFASPLGQVISHLLADVSDSNKLSIYADKHSSINFFYLMELTLFTSLALIFKKYFYQNKNTMLIFNGFLLYILVSIVGLTNASFARLTWYFFIFVVLAIPHMYNFLSDEKLKRVFKIIAFLYYSMVFFRLLFVFDNGDFMPYKTIFQDFDRNGMWEFMEYRNEQK